METALPTPNVEEATRFLTALCGAGASFGFATFDDRGDDHRLAHRLYGDLAWSIRLTGKKAGLRVGTPQFLTFMQSLNAGVFVTVNELDGYGAKAENVRRIRAMIADADSAQQIGSLHSFIACTGLVPSKIVESGGLALAAGGALTPKLQAYWLVDDCPVHEYADCQKELNARAGCDPMVQDPARVLRLPGFWHLKKEPRQTHIVAINDVRYNFSDFKNLMQEAPIIASLSPQGTKPRGAGTRTGATVPPTTRDRLRALIAAHDGKLRPAVAAFLAEARGPDADGGGNRHHTLLTAVGALVHYGWNDPAIHAAVTIEADRLWGGSSRRTTVQPMINHARQHESLRLASMKRAFARSFGGGRR